jgi:hypothetical protein
MSFKINYQDPEWWFWAVSLVAIAAGLLGLGWGFTVTLWVGFLNLVVYAAIDRSLTTMRVQVRAVWLGLVLIASFVTGLGWLYYALFIGMVLVVFFDRCGIQLVLGKMPWNKRAAL